MDIEYILDKFEKITLEQMDNVKLMDRVDVKYILPYNRLSFFLDLLATSYKVLSINNIQISQYETLYYDTPELELFKNHLTGRLNRYKVRYRRYADSDLSFFEIKYKNNKGRTLKNREVSQSGATDAINQHQYFLECHSPYKDIQLESCLWVFYKRITLVNNHSKERLTIDLDLTFKDEVTHKSYSDICIIEVKQDSSAKSKAKDILKQMNIRAGSISKYCLGVISLKKKVKYNRFKPQIRLVNKISKKNAIKL